MALVARYPMNGNANNVVTTYGISQLSFPITTQNIGLKSLLNGNDNKASQSITTPSDAIGLSSVTFQMKKVGSPTGVMTLKCYSGQGTGLVATSSTINESSLTTSYASYTFNFNGEAISSSTLYYFTLESTNTADGSNYVHIGASTIDSNYPNGTGYNVTLGGTYNTFVADLGFVANFVNTVNINGTATGSVSWVDGKEGQAASFMGVSTSYIIIPSAFYDLIKTRNDYWFDFWIYSGTTVNQIPLSYSAAADFYFYISSAGKITLRRGTNFTAESGNSFEFNKWQKFTIQYTSATNANLYKNGTLVQSFTVSATPNTTTNFYIGRYFDTTFAFTGKVDRFQVGTGNLSVAEIKNDYLLTAGHYGQ